MGIVDHLADPWFPVKASGACDEFIAAVYAEQAEKAQDIRPLMDEQFWDALTAEIQDLERTKYNNPQTLQQRIS